MKIGFIHRSQLFRWPRILLIEFTTIEVLFNISEKIVIGINSSLLLDSVGDRPTSVDPRYHAQKYSEKDQNENSIQIFPKMGTMMTNWLEMGIYQ